MSEKFDLSCGIRLVVEYLPHLRSVTSGIWVNCGSVNEDIRYGGVSHFLEHMLFKGTKRRDSLAIASQMEAVGGMLNAFTGKEHTCYYTRSLDEHFALQLDLLADMYLHSLLDAKEFAREKNVILEEINMYEDSPDEIAMDLFVSTLYPDHPYGPPIIGTIESVSELAPDRLHKHYQDYYSSSNTVLAIAGNIEPQEALELAEKSFTDIKNSSIAQELSIPKTVSKGNFICKDIEQNHICLGFPAIPLDDDDYYAATIIANAFGGGASSRIFQEIREKRGLAYSAFCYLETYVKGGFLMAYAATAPKKSAEVIKVLAEQFLLLKDQGLSEKELSQSQAQLKGNLLLSMESTANVMSKMGRLELALGKKYDIEETTRRLMAVKNDDIKRVINRIVNKENLVSAQVGQKHTAVKARELL